MQISPNTEENFLARPSRQPKHLLAMKYKEKQLPNWEYTTLDFLIKLLNCLSCLWELLEPVFAKVSSWDVIWVWIAEGCFVTFFPFVMFCAREIAIKNRYLRRRHQLFQTKKRIRIKRSARMKNIHHAAAWRQMAQRVQREKCFY